MSWLLIKQKSEINIAFEQACLYIAYLFIFSNLYFDAYLLIKISGMSTRNRVFEKISVFFRGQKMSISHVFMGI
ncbi:hypothetical protein ZORO111903_17285 [Zobellia roscoffensis]